VANKSNTGTCVTMEYTTKIPLGGINAPNAPAVATVPPAKRSETPAFSTSGIEIRPTVAAVTMLEPQTAENPAHAETGAIGSPPGKWPSQVRATLNARSESPAR